MLADNLGDIIYFENQLKVVNFFKMIACKLQPFCSMCILGM